MSSKGTVVVLTDGEPRLASFMDMLRHDGWRVLATSRAYEIVFWLTRTPIKALVARAPLLPDSGGEFLRRIHDLHPRPMIILLHARDDRPDLAPSLFDIAVSEPLDMSELVHLLETGPLDPTRLGGEFDARLRSPLETAETSAWLPITIPKIYQVVNACRVLAELERDREQLLSTSLDMFMRLTESRRGSIMLHDPETKVMRLVRSVGFPEPGTPAYEIGVGEPIAGAVFVDEKPLMVNDVGAAFPDRPTRAYRGGAFIVVPLSNLHTTLGVVNLTDRVGGESYGKDDLVHALMLADQTAITLSNSRLIEDLHAMTVVDPLTQLFNRRHFDAELRREIDRARRYGRQLTLSLLDIDNFKLFNDVNGYVTGDRVLKFVGQILLQSFRSVDVVTRWGGDEFAVILPETGRGATKVHPSPRHCIERVLRAVEQADLRRQIPELAGRITLSVGVATFPDDAGNDGDLFSRANRALHRAKRSGTNRTCYAGEDEGLSSFG